MKYLVKTRAVEIWNRWYVVEADSGDEANNIVNDMIEDSKDRGDYDERFAYTDEEEVEEIELFDDKDL